ncbi:MEF2BNB [Mytilus coruscus]|uniref:MEF2BNB n=1 Tax=Mytilus coruscus TaxID=42192 RepID=A0A6J8B663_MYTCO|nr:MEF2BNB [Mytilus coruscus]
MQGGDSLYNRMATANLFKEAQDAELEYKARKVTDKISENMNVIANEPSLAFFRIQEHVRKSLPQLVETKHEVQDIQQKVQGASFDTEYATNAVKNLQKSSIHFQNIQDLMKNAMFMKQQIDYQHDRREQEKVRSSMYMSLTDEQLLSDSQSHDNEPLITPVNEPVEPVDREPLVAPGPLSVNAGAS